MPGTDSLEPFTIDVSEHELTELRNRIRTTRWSLDLDNEDSYYGLSVDYLKPLVEYWADGFDWRAAERRINAFKQYRPEIGGTPVHFIYEHGSGPAPIPIVLSHGWPWTFWDYSKVIRPLADPANHGGDAADSFDVIVPSLPGFGFSTPTRGDMNQWKMADIWHELMTTVLGYDRYAASGTDYGARVTSQLGHKYADWMYGIHLGQDRPPMMFNRPDYWSTGELPSDAPPEVLKEHVAFQETYHSHVAVHLLDGQTITHALSDSPVGMLAWILQKWRKWSDKNGDFEQQFPRDHILTNATIYWVTHAIGQTIRAYKNAVRYPWTPSHDRIPLVEAPAGFTFLSGDRYPPATDVTTRIAAFENGPTRQFFNPIYVKAHAAGGHFVPWENPEAYIDDVRATFRLLR
jgi:pimeloyl-ACP methyl ester carboxylesterase